MKKSNKGPRVFKSWESQQKFLTAYNKVLQQWPVKHEEINVETTFGTTHVIASGSSQLPPLLLLPTMLGTAMLWRANVETLSQSYRVYAVDTIGQVGKSVPRRRMRSRRIFADWISELQVGLGFNKSSIIGNSYGGFLATNQAILAPETVDKIVLISPAGTFVGGLLWLFLKSRIQQMFSGNIPLDLSVLIGPKSILREEHKNYIELMILGPKTTAIPNLINPKVFRDKELRSITSPVLLLIGENELIYHPDKVFQRARSTIPMVTTALIRNAVHLAGLANPLETNDYILDFLRNNR